MPKTVGLIDADVEERVMTVALEKEEQLKNIGGEEYEEFLKKKALFNEVNTVWNRRRKVSYQTLPYLLDYAGINMKEMYELFGIELDWPTEDAKEFYASICSLSKEDQSHLLRVIKSIGASLWYAPQQEDRKMMTNPTRRAIWVIRRKYDTSDSGQLRVAKGLGDEFIKAWMDKKFYTTISIKLLPEVSKKLQVSIHWLLGNDKSTTSLAATPMEEQIMSGYLFLTEKEQMIAKEYVALSKEEK